MPTTSKGLRYPSNTDGPFGPLQIQQLAADVDAALPGFWTVMASGNKAYKYTPGTSWGQVPQFSNLGVTVPNGRQLEVEYRIPRVNLGASAQISARLRIGTAITDSWDVVTGSGSSGTSSPHALVGRVVGTGAFVGVTLEAIRAGTGGAFMEGSNVTDTGILTDGDAGPVMSFRIT